MSPTSRAALLLAGTALSALVIPVPVAGLIAVALAGLMLVDAWLARARPTVERVLPDAVSRGIPTEFTIGATHPYASAVKLRQPAPPDIAVTPGTAVDRMEGRLTARHRGRHPLAPVATRSTGPLRLASWDRAAGEEAEVLVYPDLVSARRIRMAVRHGRFRDPSRRSRGPLGLGTEFESIRDYLPDDDVRHVNWRATARTGRPMSNQYRIEQDRDVLCVVDKGRLMAAPLGDRTRIDAAVDAVTAVALVADEVGDRCGVVAFDDQVRRNLAPRRGAGPGVVRAIFDLEAAPVESDYELAFRMVARRKRALVMLFTDLLEPSAAQALLSAIPVLVRRHAVVVAAADDTEVTRILERKPEAAADVYHMAVALDVVQASRTVARRLVAAGADVVTAGPAELGQACVAAYLRAKERARL